MKRWKPSAKGGFITVSVAIVLAIVCFFQLVLTDTSAIISGRYFYKNRVRMALESILASYDSILFSKYALLGLNVSSYDSYETDFIRYISEPVQTNVLSFSRMDRREADISLCDSLSEPESLKQSIVDNMKYRTVANGALYIAGALGLIGEADSFTGAAGHVAEAEKLLGEAKNKTESLKKLIEGYFSGDNMCVNGYKTIVNNLYLKFGQMFIKQLSVSDILTSADILEESLGEIYNNIRLYESLNVDAFDTVAELKRYASEIDRCVNKAKKELSAVSDEENRQSLEKRIRTLETESIRLSNDGLTDKLRTNISEIGGRAAMIADCIEMVDVIITAGESATEENTGFSPSDFIDNIRSAFDLSGINCDLSVSTYYVNSDPGLSELDPRGKIISDDSIYTSDSYVIDNTIYATLPSVRNNIPGSYLEIIKSFDNIDGIIDSLSGLFSSFNVVSALETAVDKVLICDYVSSYFSDVTSVSASGVNNSFQCEKEYVIGGNKNSDDNIKNVSNKLLGIRFVFNFMHCYSDEPKHSLASEIGNSIAALVSAGIGGEIYAFLIICAWSFAESYEDVRCLRGGVKVALLKSSSTWKTSIEGLISSGAENTDTDSDKDRFALNYSQYLILLMLLMPSESLLYRIADVIEVNMTDYTGSRYMLSGVFTGVKCKITYLPVIISPFFKSMGREKLKYEISEKVTY